MFKKPKKDSIIDNAVKVGSAVGGGMLSNGAVELIPVEEDQKDYVRMGLAAAGIIGAASTKSTDMIGKIAQSAFAGVAIEQIKQLVTGFMSKTVTAPVKGDSPTRRFISGVAGLNCGCNSMPRVQMPTLNMPSFRGYSYKAKSYGVAGLQEVTAATFN